jgi:hypothetical protein
MRVTRSWFMALSGYLTHSDDRVLSFAAGSLCRDGALHVDGSFERYGALRVNDSLRHHGSLREDGSLATTGAVMQVGSLWRIGALWASGSLSLPGALVQRRLALLRWRSQRSRLARDVRYAYVTWLAQTIWLPLDSWLARAEWSPLTACARSRHWVRSRRRGCTLDQFGALVDAWLYAGRLRRPPDAHWCCWLGCQGSVSRRAGPGWRGRVPTQRDD